MAIDGNGQRVGQVVQIIGPVVDVEFSNDYLPQSGLEVEILNADEKRLILLRLRMPAAEEATADAQEA